MIGNVKADTVKANVIQVAPNAGAGKVFVSDADGNGSFFLDNVVNNRRLFI